MKTTEINLANEVLGRLESLGIEKNKNVYTLLSYYLTENFKKMLGRNILDSEEMEMVKTKEEISFTTIFEEGKTYVITVNAIGGVNKCISCTCKETGEEVFNITVGDLKVTNHINALEDDKMMKYHYEANLDGEEYKYFVGESEGVDYSYGASLVPLNAKYRDRETYELTRIIPPQQREASIVKRIVDTLKGEGYVSIVTSVDLHDTFDYVDCIFDRLVEESKKHEMKLSLNNKE